MVTTMGLDPTEQSLSARLGGRHPRCDFGIQVEFGVLTVCLKNGDKSMLLIQRPCLGKNQMP